MEQPVSSRRYQPLAQIVLARTREFYREPEAVFWVYGFPILMVVALGIAFRNKPVEKINVAVVVSEHAESARKVQDSLSSAESTSDRPPAERRFELYPGTEGECRLQLRVGKVDLVVLPREGGQYEYLYDPTRSESLLARNAVDDELQRAAGREDPVSTTSQEFTEPGGRYIDFLVPGLLGMSIMGGGLWGIGFVTVDMRIRKLLKRFLATPMKKRDFLAGMMLSRMAFLVPEVLVLILFSWLIFDVGIYGNILSVIFLVLLGSFTFMGLGLLVASRAKTIEAVSGLMNLVMLPLWIFSGIFFSSERFPDAIQPFIKALPLTPLINSLRAVMRDGASIFSQLPEVGLLAAWGVVTFALALKWFRWN